MLATDSTPSGVGADFAPGLLSPEAQQLIEDGLRDLVILPRPVQGAYQSAYRNPNFVFTMDTRGCTARYMVRRFGGDEVLPDGEQLPAWAGGEYRKDGEGRTWARRWRGVIDDFGNIVEVMS